MARRIAVAALLVFIACSQTKTVTEVVTVPAPDETPPLVLLASPAGDATGVPLNARVSATFSETMDPVAVATSLSLVGPSGLVAGILIVSLDARAVTFSPAAALDPGSLYTASISTIAADAAGNHLEAPATWSFRTGAAPDVTPPAVVSVSPAAGSLAAAATTASVSATFSEPIDCARLPAGALALFEGNVPVPGYVDCGGTLLEFVPVPALPTLTSLVAIVSPLVLDLAGNPLGAARVWQFDVRPWTRQLGSRYVTGGSVAVDAAGNVFITGDSGYLFVVKYDPSGAEQWTRQLGPPVGFASGVAVDAAGNVFATGSTPGDLDGNTSAGGRDLFVVKYDPSGVKQWTRQLGSPADDFGSGAAVDAAGNVFVAGSTTGDLDGNISAGGSDLFVVKYDPSGVKQWTRQLGSPADDFGYGAAVDAAGNVFVAGYTTGNLDGNASAGGSDLFLVKYDHFGHKEWTAQLGSPADDFGYGVAVDAAGNVFVAGSTTGNLDGNTSAGGSDLFVVKYDPSGVKQWTRQLGSPDDEFGCGIAVDAAGNVFVAGSTMGNLDGNTSVGGRDLFVVKYDPSGAKEWTRQLGAYRNVYPAETAGVGIAIDAAGSVFVGGWTTGNLDGNTNAYEGSFDLVVVKYGSDGRKR